MSAAPPCAQFTTFSLTRADIGETVRFRVQEVTFPRQPTPMELHEARERRDAGQVGTADNPYRPMKVVADMCGDGLGPTSWWVQAEVEDVDEEAEGMENGVA